MFRICAALAFLLAFSVPALAADETPPPGSGWFGSFRAPMIVCDTKDQIASIVAASKAKPNGAQAKYGELNAARNARAEPICVVARILNVAVGESEDLGAFQFLGDVWAHGWAVHIGVSDGEGWMLYTQVTPAPI